MICADSTSRPPSALIPAPPSSAPAAPVGRSSVGARSRAMRLPGRLLRPPSLLFQWLILRIVAGARSSSNFRDYSGVSVSENYHCYSCMSKEFESNWRHLDQIYYRPRNFTDLCLSLPHEAYIGMTPCPHSVCISIVEPRILAGKASRRAFGGDPFRSFHAFVAVGPLWAGGRGSLCARRERSPSSLDSCPVMSRSARSNVPYPHLRPDGN